MVGRGLGMTGGGCCGVFGMAIFKALDLCPCFRRGDFLLRGMTI